MGKIMKANFKKRIVRVESDELEFGRNQRYT